MRGCKWQAPNTIYAEVVFVVNDRWKMWARGGLIRGQLNYFSMWMASRSIYAFFTTYNYTYCVLSTFYRSQRERMDGICRLISLEGLSSMPNVKNGWELEVKNHLPICNRCKKKGWIFREELPIGQLCEGQQVVWIASMSFITISWETLGACFATSDLFSKATGGGCWSWTFLLEEEGSFGVLFPPVFHLKRILYC